MQIRFVLKEIKMPPYSLLYVEKTKVVTSANKFYILVIPGKLLIKPRINK